MAAPALAVDWDAVKAHALSYGVREAARAFLIPDGTVQARSAREKWLEPIRQAQLAERPQLPASMQPRATIATKPSEAALSTLVKQSGKTRAKLSRAALNGATAAAKLKGEAILHRSGDILNVAKLAEKVHGWNNLAQANPLISITIATPEQERPAAPVIDLLP
jgi:hypothetical protein